LPLLVGECSELNLSFVSPCWALSLKGNLSRGAHPNPSSAAPPDLQQYTRLSSHSRPARSSRQTSLLCFLGYYFASNEENGSRVRKRVNLHAVIQQLHNKSGKLYSSCITICTQLYSSCITSLASSLRGTCLQRTRAHTQVCTHAHTHAHANSSAHARAHAHCAHIARTHIARTHITRTHITLFSSPIGIFPLWPTLTCELLPFLDRRDGPPPLCLL
jgi:hypothetical protein